MYSHVNIGARDPAPMRAFGDAGLAPHGAARRWREQEERGRPGTSEAQPKSGVPACFVQEPFDRGSASAGNRRMAAFLASSPAAEGASHAAGLSASGSNEGAPGKRPRHGRGRPPGVHPWASVGDGLHAARRGGLAAG